MSTGCIDRRNNDSAQSASYTRKLVTPKTLTKSKAVVVYIARLPDVFFGGITAYAETREKAVALLKRQYLDVKPITDGCMSFKVACNHYGGYVGRITLPHVGDGNGLDETELI